MADDDDKTIRTAIGSLISDVQPDAKVYPFNVLSHSLNEWPGLFTAETRHGWVIKRVAQAAERKNAQRDRKRLDYDIWGFYKFRSGKIGDNSDDTFAEICSTVYEQIKDEPRLDIESVVERHDLVQFVRITTIDCGEETLHFAQGRLNVYLCC